MAGKVVGLGFEIISKLDSYFLMTVIFENPNYHLLALLPFHVRISNVNFEERFPSLFDMHLKFRSLTGFMSQIVAPVLPTVVSCPNFIEEFA